jgi:arylformamidase
MRYLYRQFASQQELDAEYDLKALTPTFLDYMQKYSEASREALSKLKVLPDLPYGLTRDEHLDLYPARGGQPPLLIFFHGGYWCSENSKNFAFAATGPVDMGISVANINYSLCPSVTIDEIVRQSRAAIAWLYRHAEQFGFDRDRMFVSGHSAGAHLAAMCILTEWDELYGLPANPIKGALLVSGVYDMRPLQYSFLQPAVQLTADQAVRNSPLLFTPKTMVKSLVTFGANETSEFRRQSTDFVATWRASGNAIEELSQSGADHFSVMFDFQHSDSELMTELRAML